MNYDAVLLVTFGGPNAMADVMPFLENVLRGRNVPEQRMREVARHYEHVDGRSPINAQNAALQRALERRMATIAPRLPVSIGNRNWDPFLVDSLRALQADGVQRVLAFVASGYSCYSGCRQYREAIELARAELGPGAPVVDKIRVFYNHPLFVQANAEHIRAALDAFPSAAPPTTAVLCTAHSIPVAMAARSAYVAQLEETVRLVSEAVGFPGMRLVYQSRSGPPHQPWLEPDVCDVLESLAAQGVRQVVLAPIGFTSDHMEVVYDLDIEARARTDELGLHMVRASAAGHHPLFVEMVHDLIAERVTGRAERPALGTHGPSHDVCPVDCCLQG